MLNLIKKKNSENVEKVYICQIPVYSKSIKDNCIKCSYLFSIFQTKTYKYQTDYYFMKIKFREKFHFEEFFNQQFEQTKLSEKRTCKQDSSLENNLTTRITYLKTLIQCQSLHKETFGPYKYAFKDKTVVLVASGPTAQYHSQIDDAIYVGVNNACLLEKIKLDYLFCQDFYMDEEKRNAIVNYRPNECQKFFGRIPDLRYEMCLKTECAKHVRRCPKYLINDAKAKEYYVQDEYQNSFALDIEKEPLSPAGIAFSALQFILHAHPNKIYLVGCDCSSGFFYKSNITFNAEYQINTWKRVKQQMEDLYPDIEIVSINPVGLKGLFKDEYTDNYIESLSNEERAVINV